MTSTSAPFAALTRASAAILLTACLAGAAAAAPTWDAVGLKLGMTEQEARAALKAHAPQGRLADKLLKFTFSDGAKQQETPAFLSTLESRIPGPAGSLDNEGIELTFSPPPSPQRVVRVRRAVTSYGDPPALPRVIDSFVQKYGKPANQATYGVGTKTTVLDWVEPGRPVCGHKGDASKGLLMTPVAQAPDALRIYQRWQQQKLAPADLSTCSARLRATLTTQPGGSSVATIVVEMSDASHAVPALEATAKWLADLEAEARRARLNSGAAPKL